MKTVFPNIVGNDSLKSLISSHISSGTLSHAYIIEGKKGSGKHLIANEICKAIYCEKSGDSFPCGYCRGCRRTEEKNNTDVFYLNKGDKASITVQDVRDMTDTLGYYPDDGDSKVYVIEDAEKMTDQAQNALLLSLEEPPSYVIFLLLTEDSGALLETVRSRSQILRTESFSSSFVAKWLRSHPLCKNASEEDVFAAAAASQGSLGAALSTLTDKSSKARDIPKDALRLVDLLCTDSKAEAIIFASGIKYSRAEFEIFFDYALFAVRDLISAKCRSESTTYYADIEIAREKASKVKLSKLVRIYNELVRAKDDITINNAHVYAVMTTLAANAV